MALVPICTICQESVFENPVDGNDNGNGEPDFPIITKCGHFYHNGCIKRWFGSGAATIQNNGTRCPYCNKHVSKDSDLIRVYPITERDEVQILEHNLNEAPPPVELDGAGIDQICLLSTRNDKLAEEIQCLQEVLGSTEQENRALLQYLKGVQDELTKVKIEKAIADAVAVGKSSNSAISSSPQPSTSAAARIGVNRSGLTLALCQELPATQPQLKISRLNPLPTFPMYTGSLWLPSPFEVGQTVILLENNSVAQVKCLLRDIATANVFVGVEFDQPPVNGMSGVLGTLQVFCCKRGHGLIVLSSMCKLCDKSIQLAAQNNTPESDSEKHWASMMVCDFPLEKKIQISCDLVNGSVGTLLGKVECHLVDLRRHWVIVGVQFDKPVVGGMSGEIAGVQLFKCLPNHARLILTLEINV